MSLGKCQREFERERVERTECALVNGDDVGRDFTEQPGIVVCPKGTFSKHHLTLVVSIHPFYSQVKHVCSSAEHPVGTVARMIIYLFLYVCSMAAIATIDICSAVAMRPSAVLVRRRERA